VTNYTNESVAEGARLSHEREHHGDANAISLAAAVLAPEPTPQRIQLADSPLTLPKLDGEQRASADARSAMQSSRPALTPVLLLIPAFALGAVVSLWLFHRISPARVLPLRAHQAAPDTTSAASHLAQPSTSDAGVTKETFTPAVELKAGAARYTDDSDGAQPASEKTARAPADMSKAAAVHAARSNDAANKGGDADPPPRADRQAITTQPTPQAAKAAGGRCTLALSKSKLTLRSKGAAEVAVSLGDLIGQNAITASTGDWANIVVFPGARRGGVALYRIVSVSQRPGTYGVNFSAPCGTRRVAVTVE
jgi:hypothetical protein